MRPTGWQRIAGFEDFLHVESQEQWLAEQVEAGLAVPVPVVQPFANVGEVERWFLDSTTGQHWRLIEPAPPFRGLFDVVPQSLLQHDNSAS